MRPRRSRGWMWQAAWLTGLLVMACAQYAIRRDPNSTAATVVFVGAAAVVAIILGQGAPARAAPAGATTTRERSSRRPAGGVVAVVGGLLAVAAGAAALCVNWAGVFFIGWGALVAGVALLSAGLWALDPARDRALPWTGREALVLAALVALGAYLRFHRYADFPEPFSTHAIEEQQAGLAAYRILTAHARPWEFMLDYHLAALALWLSDDPTFLTIRIPFTVVSALTVLPVHLLLRRLVSVPAALAGTFLYSVSSWNIIYSRCAHNIFLTNFLVVAVLAMLVQFGQTRRLAVMPWVGLLSGYTLYSYAGYRGTLLFAVVFLGALFASDLWRWRRSRHSVSPRRIGRDLAAIGLAVAVAAAVVTPLARLLRADAANPYYYFEAANRSLANEQYYTKDPAAFAAQRLQRVRETARIFMHVGDGSLTFNDPDKPMLDPVTATCFVAGLLLILCFPWRGYNAFLIFMFVALMIGGTVFVQNLDVRRLQGITVFVVLFSAVFLDHVWRAMCELPRRVSRTLMLILALGLGAYALWWNYDLYFLQMARNPRVREAFKNHYTTVIRYGRERYRRDGGNPPYILLVSLLQRFFDPGYYYGSHYVWLHNGYMRGRDLADLGDVLPPKVLPRNEGRLSIAIQEPYERRGAADLLAISYPGTRCADFSEADNPHTDLTVCDLPPEPVPQPIETTLRARYWLTRPGSAVPQGGAFLERAEPFIGYAFVPMPCYDGPQGSACLAEWEGTFEVRVAGDYQFRTEARGRSRVDVRIDGNPVGTEPLHLTAGSHALTARAQLPREAESGVRLLWVRDGRTELVPFYAAGSGAGAAGQR